MRGDDIYVQWMLYGEFKDMKPSVYIIKARLPEFIEHYLRSGKLVDLFIYFSRQDELSTLKFTEFFNRYRWSFRLGVRLQNLQRGEASYFQIFIPEVNKIVYISRRDQSKPSLTRMEMLYPNAGEIWFLRLIFLNKPCMSFDDAKTVNNHECATFQIAAISNGFVTDKLEALRCFESAFGLSSPAQLRYLFATLTLQGGSTHEIFNTYVRRLLNKEEWQ